MGSIPTRKSDISKSQNPNGNKLTILAEFCSSWGYNSSYDSVVKILVGALNNEGYDVDYTVEPLSGGNGEYYVYKINTDGTKKIIFSNNRNLHSSQGAVIGYSIKSNNVNEVVKKLVSWFPFLFLIYIEL